MSQVNLQENEHQQGTNTHGKLNGYLPQYHHNKDFTSAHHYMHNQRDLVQPMQSDQNVLNTRPARPTFIYDEEPQYFSRPDRRRSPARHKSPVYRRESEKTLYNEGTRRDLEQMVYTPNLRRSKVEEKKSAKNDSRHFINDNYDEENLIRNLPPRPPYTEELMERFKQPDFANRPHAHHGREQTGRAPHHMPNGSRQRKTNHTTYQQEHPSEPRHYSNGHQFSRYAPSAARPTPRPKQGQTPTSFNIGIAGARGAGKSELIDAIRGIERGDLSSARVPKSHSIHPFFFDDPSSEHIVLIEIPYPTRETYTSFIRGKQLNQKLQYLLIVISGSVREEDISFAMAAHRAHIPIVFVFTKCDVDLLSAADELSLLTPTEQCRHYRENGRSYFMNEIRRHAPELQRCPVFFVSSPVIRKLWQSTQHHAYEKIPEYVLDERAALDYFLEIVSNVNGGNFSRV
uniref:IRG-type G domain-containing protein n=1 Tax=Plectus sambesii TaxID=2011161 RepID=A0A914W1N8_9BILA